MFDDNSYFLNNPRLEDLIKMLWLIILGFIKMFDDIISSCFLKHLIKIIDR